jgi:hypothetical protein
MSCVPLSDRSLPARQAPHRSLASISIIGRTRAELRVRRYERDERRVFACGNAMWPFGAGLLTAGWMLAAIRE